MRKLRHLMFCIALASLALPVLAQEGSPPPAHLNEDRVPAVMARAVDEVIRPGYRNFHQSAGRLTAAMQTLCAAPSDKTLQDARVAFADTVKNWGRIEIVRIGPVIEANRFERVLFYPDRKSTGMKQVQALLAKPDENAVRPGAIAGKSVAMQGLGALEYVLSGTGNEDLLARRDGFRCRYGTAVAGNVEQVAGELVDAWDKPDGVQAAWKNPGAANPVFRDNREAITALLGILVHGAETVRDQRLEAFYKGEGKALPKQAIFWRSRNTFVSVAANLDGLRALLDTSDMASLIDEDQRSVVDSIDFVLNQLARKAETINPDIEAALDDSTDRAKLDYMLLNGKDLILRLSDNYGAAIGLGAGFSFSDGD